MLPELRQCALAVAVLHDIDLLPEPDGVRLLGPPTLTVSWDWITDVVVRPLLDPAADPEAQPWTSRPVVDRLAAWLRTRQRLAECRPDQLVALGLPVGHELHQGADWALTRVPGGALDVGFGLAEPERLGTPVAVSAVRHAGLFGHWPGVWQELDRCGALAAERWQRRLAGPLKPVSTSNGNVHGLVDVVSLLASPTLRRALVADEPDGLAALIIPLRNRGWRLTAVTDPAFGPAIAATAEPVERGFVRPVLVSAEEVALVREGGDPLRQVLGVEGG